MVCGLRCQEGRLGAAVWSAMLLTTSLPVGALPTPPLQKAPISSLWICGEDTSCSALCPECSMPQHKLLGKVLYCRLSVDASIPLAGLVWLVMWPRAVSFLLAKGGKRPLHLVVGSTPGACQTSRRVQCEGWLVLRAGREVPLEFRPWLPLSEGFGALQPILMCWLSRQRGSFVPSCPSGKGWLRTRQGLESRLARGIWWLPGKVR